MVDLDAWRRARATAYKLDETSGGMTYVFLASVALYCTEQIIAAIRERAKGGERG
jgi:hypothetical protein